MTVARQLAQAVLGLALLGLVVRLLAAAITNDHDRPPPATLARVGSATSAAAGCCPVATSVATPARRVVQRRFWHRDRPGALVGYCYYVALDLDDLATVYVERQTECLVCTDPEDPGGTEVWSDYRYEALEGGFGSVEAATAAARRAAGAHVAYDEDWSGRPPWDSE